MPKRYAKKVDNNHTTLKAELKALGACVIDLSRMGKGIPDLLVTWQGLTFFVEIKSAKGKLTEDQWKFAETWKGYILVVRTLDEFKTLFNEMKKELMLEFLNE